MPYEFEHATLCTVCPHGVCVEDRRVNRVRGRNTRFRLKQHTALACTFGDFIPGGDGDPDPSRTFDSYLAQFRLNANAAGQVLFGPDFSIESAAFGKVEGDVFELLEAATLWNAAATWNTCMDTGVWNSTRLQQPAGTVPTALRKVAIVKLPRGYDATKLFRPEVRASILAHEASLRLRGMELGLSSPDIVGVRVPEPVPESYRPFLSPLAGMTNATRQLLEGAYLPLEGTVDSRAFLLAIAVKRSTRSDRMYQPLFEANVLKYLIEFVLRGAAFRFHVHMGTFDGADVVSHYRAASLVSLMRGGSPSLAVDHLLHVATPLDAAQAVINDLPLFPM